MQVTVEAKIGCPQASRSRRFGTAGNAFLASLVLLLAACSSGDEDAAVETTTEAGATTTQPTSVDTTTEETTTEAEEPITAAEAAWVRELKVYTKRTERKFEELKIITSLNLASFAKFMDDCRPMLIKGGPPSDRFAPAYAGAERACVALARAADASRNAAEALHDPNVAATDRVLDKFFTAYSRGQARLARAVAEAENIKASLPRA
jgi:hypothetical protein